MRKTIDEIKSELSNAPNNTSFRILSRKEQGDIMGKAHYLLSDLPRDKAYQSPLPKHLRSFFNYFSGK